MLTLYRPGHGWLHRAPAGAKLLALTVLAVAVAMLPAQWWTVAVSASVATAAYAGAGLGVLAGLRELARQVWSLRWIIVIMLLGQLVFLGPEPAAANTARVIAAIALAGLIPLTTRVGEILDTIERLLRPLDRLGADAARTALLLTVTLTTVPVLGRLAAEVRDAQHARGARASLRTFVVPFLVLALKHADELGDALTARGFR